MKNIFLMSLGILISLNLGCAKDRSSNHTRKKAAPSQTSTNNNDANKNGDEGSTNGTASTDGSGAGTGGAQDGSTAGGGGAAGVDGSDPAQTPGGAGDETAQTVDYVKLMAEKQKQHPQELAKCLENAEKLNGNWKQWSFVIENWYLGDSTEKITPEKMVEKGFNVTRELFPIQQEVSVQKEASQLVAKMLFSTAADAQKGSVVFAIYPEPQTEECIWAQSPTAGGRPLFADSWVLVKAKSNTIWEHNAAVPIELRSENGEYRADGYLRVFKE